MLNSRSGLPARTTWKQLSCSKAAAGCQSALLGSSFGAQRPLRPASPHRLEAALVLEGCCGLPACTATHCLEAALVLKGRCGLPARTAWNHRLEAPLVLKGFGLSPRTALKAALVLKCRCGLRRCKLPDRTAACLDAALVLKDGCRLPARTASRCLETALVLKRRCGLPARTAWKQLWCSKAAACQPAPLGSSFGAQRALGLPAHRRALLGSSFGAQRPPRAASPHRLEAALVLKNCCVLQLWCSKAAAGCQPHRSALLGSSFGAQRPLRAATRHLKAALVLKNRCGLPARTAWKQLWCSKAAASCQPAPLGSSFGAPRPLRAASPHRGLHGSILVLRPLRPARCWAARTGWKQLWCPNKCSKWRAASPQAHTAWKQLWFSMAAAEAAFVLKSRCRLLARTAWKQLGCSKAAAGCQPAPLGRSFGAQTPLRIASLHRLEAALVLQGRCGLPARTAPHCLEEALVLKCRCGLPARTACKQLSCSKAAAGCQPAPLGNSFRAYVLKGRCRRLPARTAGSSFGAQTQLRASSPHPAHRLQAALVLKRRCGLAPLRTAWKQLWCSKAAAGCQAAPLRTNSKQLSCSSRFGLPARTAWKQLWCSAAAGCQPAQPEAALVLKGRCLPAPLAGTFGVKKPLRAASPHRSSPLGSSFGAQRPLRAASPHCLEAALVLKRRCGLPARAAWKQLWCSKAAAGGCQPAPLAGNSGAQKPHCLQAALVLKNRCGLPACTAWKQLWCSNAATAARLKSSFGAQNAAAHCLEAAFQRQLRAASPHCLEAAFVLKGRCGLPARTAWKQLWCSKAAAGCQAAPLRTACEQLWCSKAAAGCHAREAALVLKGRCGLPARTAWKQVFRPQRPLRAASPHHLEAALVLKGCQPAPLGTACKQRQLRAASPHRFKAGLVLKGFGLPARLEAALVLKSRCGLPAHTAWKQLWCSKAAAGCQPAPLGSSFGAQRPLQAAASPHHSAPFASSFGA